MLFRSNIWDFCPPNLLIKPIEHGDLSLLCRMINDCYSDIKVTISRLESLRNAHTFCPELWLFAYDEISQNYVGSIICDFDKECREVSLEWVQVLPKYRNMKVGQTLVNQSLFAMKSFSDFATVSGKLHSPHSPLTLYKKCGFEGNNIWHILKKKV